MSNIDMILDALFADIPPNVVSDRGDEIWDAGHALQSAIMDRLADEPDAQAMVDRYRESPDIYGSVLAQALVDNGIHEDALITELAGEVLALVDPLDAATDTDDVEDVLGTYGTGDQGTQHV